MRKSWKRHRFYFLGLQNHWDGDCSYETERCLLLERKALTNLESILKSRDITLLTKVHVVKAIVFPVVMYGCESWTIKKAECRRIDAFELWCWRRVPWTAGRSNESILKEINPEYLLEGLMLKLQHLGHVIGRADSLEKTLIPGKIEGKGRRGQQMMRWSDGITDSMDMSWANSEIVKDREACCAAVHGVTKSRTRLSAWTTTCSACVLNCFSRVWLCATLWTGACQPPTPMGFSRQEYWGGLQFPPPEDLPDPCLLRLLHCRQILYRSIGEASYNNHACRQLEWLLSKSTNN